MKRRRRYRDAQRHYAILGYLARFGPCPAEEVAAELDYKLDGLICDLAVMKAVWHTVGAGWEDNCIAYKTQTMPAKPPAPNAKRRRVYWLAAPVERYEPTCPCGCPKVGDGCNCHFCNEPYPTEEQR